MKKLTIYIVLVFGLLAISINAQTVDNLAPEILEVNVSDDAVDVRTDSKTVFFTVRATDAISGVSNVTLYVYPGSDYIIPLKLDRVWGDSNDGIYVGSVIIRAGEISGRWTLLAIAAADAAGNIRDIRSNEFVQRGFATGFQVISNSLPPTLPPKNRKRMRPL